MSMTIAALKGRLGSTDYFVASMKAGELVKKAFTSPRASWDNMPLEEREQHNINHNRVREQLAPYIANDEDRFFGAIILVVKGLHPDNFQSLDKLVAGKLPGQYRTETLGFLTLSGNEQLIPLDGRHRLKAIQFAITGTDHESRKIPGIAPKPELANEDITVILVPFHARVSKLLNNIHRYARPPSAGQKLIMEHDDYIAVSARMVANQVIGADLVKYNSNALNATEGHFTTLLAVSRCNESILTESFGRIDRTRPIEDEEKLVLYEHEITDTWRFLLGHIALFRELLEDRGKAGNQKRRELRRDYLLGNPVPQHCLFQVYLRLMKYDRLSREEAASRLNRMDWRKDAPVWDRLLITGKKILHKNGRVAADIIYYLVGGQLDGQQLEKLLADYRQLFPAGTRREIQLPPKVFQTGGTPANRQDATASPPKTEQAGDKH